MPPDLQGYTIILFDEEAAFLEVQEGLSTAANYKALNITANPLVNFSSTIVKAGFTFVIRPKEVTAPRNTKVTIFGNESGVTKTMSLTINPTT